MPEKHPNLLLIMTDEQPVQTVGAYGHGLVDTPHLDKLSRESTLFQRAYTSSPVCTPARAGLFSGIYPHNTGAWSNHLALGQDPLEQVNLIDDARCADTRDRLHRQLLDWSCIRRDAFRSPQWEQRPWSDSKRFALCRGRIRTAPPNGLGPEARGYMTGNPIEYDFTL